MDGQCCFGGCWVVHYQRYVKKTCVNETAWWISVREKMRVTCSFHHMHISYTNGIGFHCTLNYVEKKWEIQQHVSGVCMNALRMS